MLSSGVPAVYVSMQMGHKNAASLSKYSSHDEVTSKATNLINQNILSGNKHSSKKFDDVLAEQSSILAQDVGENNVVGEQTSGDKVHLVPSAKEQMEVAPEKQHKSRSKKKSKKRRRESSSSSSASSSSSSSSPDRQMSKKELRREMKRMKRKQRKLKRKEKEAKATLQMNPYPVFQPQIFLSSPPTPFPSSHQQQYYPPQGYQLQPQTVPSPQTPQQPMIAQPQLVTPNMLSAPSTTPSHMLATNNNNVRVSQFYSESILETDKNKPSS